MEERLELYLPGEFAFHHDWKNLLCGLNGTFCPAVLLRLIRINLDRNFSGRYHIGNEEKFPSAKLRPVGTVQIFCQCIVLPSTRLGNCCASPDARRSIKIEETSGAIPRNVLDYKMSIEHDRLNLCQ